MGLLETVDALLVLLEPGGAIDTATDLRPATSGVIVNHSGEDPFRTDFAPNTLYGKPLRDAHRPIESGGATTTPDWESFTLELTYVVDSKVEYDAKRSIRAVSAALDDKAHAYAATLRRNRSRYENGSAAPWHDVYIAGIDWTRMRSLGVRGIVLQLTGRRHLG